LGKKKAPNHLLDKAVKHLVEAVCGKINQLVQSGGKNMSKTRIRDLGVPTEGQPGPWNAITDVPGVTVGHVTLIHGDGPRQVGKGPVRTGVTAIRPRGESPDPVLGAWYSLNGCGEMTGTIWLEESGLLLGPVMITNTYSVGVVRDAVIEWFTRKYKTIIGMPVVAETYDGALNDIDGFHVKKEHAFQALEAAAEGPVDEGNVGGGTGMTCHGFKGGIGTSSRVLTQAEGGWTVGVLVQANHGQRRHLRVAGVPVGQEITDLRPEVYSGEFSVDSSSIIVILATDAPLLPHQLKALARRVPLGIARVGGNGDIYSGDIFLAFSTQPLEEADERESRPVKMLNLPGLTPLFEATAQATEEAILNALAAAETMSGCDGTTFYALPKDRLSEVLKKYSRYV
jgi:D-aminopeptidase